jgi:hypothetical protein
VSKINFYESVKPVIKKYMNRAFRAYDGEGAEIVFANEVSVSWGIDDEGTITKVVIDTPYYERTVHDEASFNDILSMITYLSEKTIEVTLRQESLERQFTYLFERFE